MLATLLEVVPTNLERYDQISNRASTKCIAKILNEVPDPILALDKSSSRLASPSTRLEQDSSEINRHFHHLELGYCISRVTDAINLLSSKLITHQKDIDNLSRFVDKKFGGASSSDSDNRFVQMLQQKLKLKLISLNILYNLNFKVNSHNYMMY